MHPQVLTAPEQLELFVQQALQKNIGEICVTDHMPLSISHAHDRLPHGSVGKYCARIRELAKRYEERIKIKCGIEIDYHPRALREIECVLEQGEFDYVLGSSHLHVFVKNYSDYTRNGFARAALENAIMAANSGLFHAITHPDMYRFVFEDQKRFPLVDDGYRAELHWDLFEELFEAVKRNGMYLEINPHLAEQKENLSFTYPEMQVAQWALRSGVRFSYGSDAHQPRSVGALLEELEAHPIYGQGLRQWESEVP